MKTHGLSYPLMLALVSPLLAACGSAYEPPAEEPAAEEAVASPVRLALAGVANNAKWTPYIEKFDGVPMALVPAGCFMMGSESGSTDTSTCHPLSAGYDSPHGHRQTAPGRSHYPHGWL